KPPTTFDADLKDAAAPVVELLGESIRDLPVVIAVANPAGQIVHVAGHAIVRGTAERIGLVPGADFSERVCGTNAVGTSALSGKPIEVRLGEPYRPALKEWISCAAPILHPINSMLLGTFGIFSLDDTGVARMREFATRAADLVSRLIESTQAIDR